MVRVDVSKHAFDRWRERVGRGSATEEEIRAAVRRHVRSKGSVMVKRGEGYFLFHRGLKIIIRPAAEGGWVVLTVWPMVKPHPKRSGPARGSG